MKKTLLVAAIFGAMIASADSYLYWMVGDSSPDYQYARVRTMGGNYLSIYDSAFDTEYHSKDSAELGTGVTGIEKIYVDDVRSNKEGLYAAIGQNATAAGFVIELYNSENTFVGESVVQYNANSIYTPGLASPGGLSLVTASSFSIPEPNSGLLMLIGCAMLGLRRRRQKKV